MRKRLLAAILFFTPLAAMADEGMWMIHHLTPELASRMEARGLKLSPEEIYSTTQLSLKDAVVSLDFSCTGSMISPDGLLITNHHCAYSDVHALSTPERNYLRGGFYAATREEEIPINGKGAWFLRDVIDVTDEVQELTRSEAAAGRGAGSRRISWLIEQKYAESTGLEASLANMWAGSRYYLSLYEVYRDVRLVAAPPESVAAFGGDIDNWEWPQHKCDFAIYRVYCAPDGSPAEYSPDNVPMHPERYLEINASGLQPGDFTMVIGYPGRTARYSSAAKVGYRTELALPISNRMRSEQMAIIKKWMDADPEVRLKYADRYFTLSNIQENDEGFVQSVDRFKVKRDIRREDRRLRRSERGLMRDLDMVYSAVREVEKNRVYYRECIVRGCNLGILAMRLKNMREGIDMDSFYAGLDMRVEKELFEQCVRSWFSNVDPKYWGSYQTEIYRQYGDSWAAMCDAMWTDAHMTKEDGIYKFFTDVSISVFSEELALLEAGRDRSSLDRKYTRAKYRMRCDCGELQYPDANSTMRLSYGTVSSFKRNGQMLPWETKASGILAKEDSLSFDFVLLPAWKQALEASIAAGCDPSVDFISDNDITGGNSGSPVLDARGRLTGLAFDGNKESLASDVRWTEGYNKCVNVDIRFVLWTLEHWFHADSLIEELTIK